MKGFLMKENNAEIERKLPFSISEFFFFILFYFFQSLAGRIHNFSNRKYNLIYRLSYCNNF